MSEKNLREHGIDEQADSSGSQEEGQARGSSLFLPTRPIYLRPIPILIITLGAIAFTLALFVQIQKAEQGPLRSSFRSNCISLSYALKQSKESYTESLLMASKMIAVEAHRLGHAFGEVSRNLIQRYPGLELNYVERVSVGEDIQFKVIRSHPGKLQESSELLATRYQQGMSASSGSGLVSEYRYLAEGVSRLELTMPVAPMGGAKGASPKGVMLASIPVSLLISKAFHGLDLTGISVQIWNTEDRNDSPALYSTSARHDHALPAL
ncbi:MAG: hypothetical protein QF473_36300, partial [Planctomycetota bacterium]|nr:hypothetical protein [Planctomycetota bacterium]